MSTFATRMAATALRLLTKYGSLVTVTRPVATGYNPSTSTMGFTTSTTYTGYGNASPFTLMELANENIQMSDLKFLFSSSTRPAVGDILTTSDAAYRVLNVDIANVNSTDVVYTLQLRI